ncbi:MAG: hypothetical protein ACLQVD_16260 [Capsulimonadaceae bacterium]
MSIASVCQSTQPQACRLPFRLASTRPFGPQDTVYLTSREARQIRGRFGALMGIGGAAAILAAAVVRSGALDAALVAALVILAALVAVRAHSEGLRLTPAFLLTRLALKPDGCGWTHREQAIPWDCIFLIDFHFGPVRRSPRGFQPCCAPYVPANYKLKAYLGILLSNYAAVTTDAAVHAAFEAQRSRTGWDLLIPLDTIDRSAVSSYVFETEPLVALAAIDYCRYNREARPTLATPDGLAALERAVRSSV